MIKVLAIDDEEPFRRLLKKELTRKGFSVETAADGESALELLKSDEYDVVLLDIVMPGIDGIELMKKIGNDPATPATVVLTGMATVETAVEAMRNGAYDYISKPYKLDELVIVINRAFEYRRLKIKNLLLEQELARKDSPDEFVGKSRQLRDIFTLVRKIAPTDSSVFIHGESGTGKELVATTIWQYSKRSNAPFTALNCAALSESLIESELFGHEKGAFTSAHQMKYGIVEVADKGTLFLDEIGELPLGLQAKLLRFLDSGEFRRVGSNKTLKVDVRVIAATNKNLSVLIQSGGFRQDLYYRLNVININIPPLRERSEDISSLAKHFLKKYSNKLSKNITDFSPQALEALNNYRWPGNARELENVVERAVIICDSETLGVEDLSIPQASLIGKNTSYSSLEEIEREHILKVLRETEGNQSRASQILGIDRKTLYLKLRKFGIEQAHPFNK
jgi:DNA-binding NtrC family response regulator